MMLDLRKQKLVMDTSYKFILKCNSVQIVNKLEVNRGGGAFVSALGCERTGSDNACYKRQNCRLSHARTRQNLGCSHRLRACVRQIGMASYSLEYGIIFIRIWHHIYWNMTSYLLEYDIIFIRIWHHINWNMLSYLLEYAVILIGICCHINRNMLSYLLEYGIT